MPRVIVLPAAGPVRWWHLPIVACAVVLTVLMLDHFGTTLRWSVCAYRPRQVRLFSPAGQPVDMPDDEVAAAFLAGHVGFAPRERVPVRLADGTPGTIDPTEFASVLREGGHFDPAAVAMAERSVACAPPLDRPRIAQRPRPRRSAAPPRFVEIQPAVGIK